MANMAVPARVQLIEHLPLDRPFSVHIFASYYCNFKCSYCVHRLDAKEQGELGFEKNQHMPADVFHKAIDDLEMFGEKPKAIIFAGHGEPLAHPDIAKMVEYAKSGNAAGRIEIVTNGSLLTEKMSDALIDAGLTRLRVSLQGLDADDYMRVCGVGLDFEKFAAQIEYFYRSKGDADLFVKIIDIALSSPDSASRFHSVFDPICDTAAVEHLFPFIKQINHEKFEVAMNQTKHGDGTANKTDICAMPFYMLVVLPNGDVTGCCAVKPPVIFGNVRHGRLYDIWNGKKRLSLLKTQIRDRALNAVCKTCTVPDCGMQKGDYLDEHRDKLKELFGISTLRTQKIN